MDTGILFCFVILILVGLNYRRVVVSDVEFLQLVERLKTQQVFVLQPSSLRSGQRYFFVVDNVRVETKIKSELALPPSVLKIPCKTWIESFF